MLVEGTNIAFTTNMWYSARYEGFMLCGETFRVGYSFPFKLLVILEEGIVFN
jgi:hypothetical protein